MSVTRPRLVAAIVLAVLGLLLAPLAPAAALDPGTPTEPTGSLTVHGFISPGGVGDGTGLPRGSEPIAGLVFTVTRIEGVDLTTAHGWEVARWYADGRIAEAALHAGTTIALPPTGADGTASASDLPLGLYLVHETESSAALRGAGALPSPDFLVTVPMVDQTNPDVWVYAVDVYPKRDLLEITKAVSDFDSGTGALRPGDVMTYTLSADVPAPGLAGFGGRCERGGVVDAGEGLTPSGFTQTGFCAPGATYVGTAAGASYRVVDDLRTQPVSGTGRMASDFLELAGAGWSGEVAVTMSDGTGLRACDGSGACDYRLTRTTTSVDVQLTDGGIMRLAEAHDVDPDIKLVVTLQARIRLGSNGQPAPIEEATRGGALVRLPNTAELQLRGGVSGATGLVISSNTVVSRYSALTIHKVDGDGRGLDGAVFAVYRSLADAEARRNAVATSAPTGADGIARVPGLHVTAFANDGASDSSYWLVETEAPTGYFALTQPVRVQISADGSTRNADATGGVPIRNQRNILLPRTGSDAAAMLAFGFGLVLCGLVVLRGARRRREPAEARG